MIELQSTKIRKKLLLLCDFYEDLIQNKELLYREGNKESHLEEINKIRDHIVSSKTFRIAFVGEYDAGKTSIINILTGENLPVSSTVETDKPTEISWNNVTIVDTPGLGSGKEEHDQITKEWLAKADLLVYILTSDLLTKHAGARLLNMLDEYKRDHEMMIVMNAIDQEGNDVAEYREDMQVLLDPRPLDIYYPVFMSAKYHEQSLNPDLDDDERQYFQEKSRFDTFLDTLNEFIINRREKAALTTPLTRLQTLSMKIAFKNKFDKECALLDLKTGLYESALNDIKSAFSDFKRELKDNAEGTAGNIFMALDSSNDINKVIDTEIKSYSSSIQTTLESLTNKVSSLAEDLEIEGKRIDNSDLGIEVVKNIENSETLKAIFSVNVSSGGGRNKSKVYIEQLKKQLEGMDASSPGSIIGKNIGDILGAKNIVEVTGKLLGKVNREVILKIGHSIGYKFKPWQAVKLASKFTKAIPLINIGAAAFEVAMHIRKEKKENKRDKQVREFKEEINTMLRKTIAETSKMVESQMLAPITTIMNTGLLMLKDNKKELLEFSETNKEFALQIESKRDECMEIYDEIYECSSNYS